MEYFSFSDPEAAKRVLVDEFNLDVADHVVRGVALPRYASDGYLAFCDRPLVDSTAERNQYAFLLLTYPELVDGLKVFYPAAVFLTVDDPRAVFIDMIGRLQSLQYFSLSSQMPAPSIVHPDTVVGEGAVIEVGVRIEQGVTVGAGAVIRAGTWLGQGVSVGEKSVIGSTGINLYIGKDGRRRSFPHLASVFVERGTSIGASAVLVRGILSSTRIGCDSILGNLCNIGHGTEIGEDAWVSVGVMIGGHSRLGSKITIGLGCAIRDNIRLGDGVSVGMGSVVTKSIPSGASVFGNPAKIVGGLNTGPMR